MQTKHGDRSNIDAVVKTLTLSLDAREPSGKTFDLSPKVPPGKHWYRVADTAAWMESRYNFNALGQEELLTSANYALAARTVLLLIEK